MLRIAGFRLMKKIFASVLFLLFLSGCAGLPAKMYFPVFGGGYFELPRESIERGFYFTEEDMNDPVKWENKRSWLIEQLSKPTDGCLEGELCADNQVPKT